VRVPPDHLLRGRLETLDGWRRSDGEVALGRRYEVVEAIGEGYVRVAAAVGADGVGEGIGEGEEGDGRGEGLKETHFGDLDGVRESERRGNFGAISTAATNHVSPILGLGNLKGRVRN